MYAHRLANGGYVDISYTLYLPNRHKHYVVMVVLIRMLAAAKSRKKWNLFMRV